MVRSSAWRAGMEHAATGGVLFSRGSTSNRPAARPISPIGIAAQTTSVARCGAFSDRRLWPSSLRPSDGADLRANAPRRWSRPAAAFIRPIALAREITRAAAELPGGLGEPRLRRGGLHAVTLPAARAAPLISDAEPNIVKALALDPENPRAWEARAFTVSPTDLVAVDRAFLRATKARPRLVRLRPHPLWLVSCATLDVAARRARCSAARSRSCRCGRCRFKA